MNIEREELLCAVGKGLISQVRGVGSIIVSIMDDVEIGYLNKRIDSLAAEIEKQGQTQKDFMCRLAEFIADEHGYFELKKAMKGLCTEAIPEATPILNKSIIEMISKKNISMQELIIESVLQLNANDIITLKEIKNFLLHPCTYQLELEYKKHKESNDIRMRDRNVIYEGKTILWKDFCHYLNMGKSLENISCILSQKVCVQREDNGEVIETEMFSYLGLSMIKLIRLGFIQADYYTRMGTSGSNDIERFHITLLGEEVMKDID